ncbi:MAG: quinone-dependent dihydroorotate dehydrogenase [Pyrinomonadaceae bacterium]
MPVTRLMLYRSLLRPILFGLSPELAHELALHSLSLALKAAPARNYLNRSFTRAPFGELKRFGLSFSNPVGLAAGFDKNGVAVDALAALGFAFIEVGTVTLKPQPGGPKPRIFRLPMDRALINRLAFNNTGAANVARNLSKSHTECVLGINIGKGRDTPIESANSDYLKTLESLYPFADYVAINVSSPNTPELRELQRPELLGSLLESLQSRNQQLASEHNRAQALPLLLKIAPDLSDHELESIVELAMRSRIAGIIATNTTISRDCLMTDDETVTSIGAGGLSGAPLRRRSTEAISLIYRLSKGALTIIGVGGIFTAADAWEKICAGASLVQLYTGFIYEGPGIARRINEGLAEILKSSAFRTLDDAVGSQAHELAAA